MEAFQSNMKIPGFGMEAPWLPAFEANSLGSDLVSGAQNHAAFGTATFAEDRHILASKLLEVLENQQKIEEPDYGWMETPMDLELFEQSLSPLIDDCSTIAHSPWVSQSSSPIHSGSPQTFISDNQDDASRIKPDAEGTADSEHLLETLEEMLKQIQEEDAAASLSTLSSGAEHYSDLLENDGSEDVASAILDSLIQGKVVEDTVLAELTDIALEWMENPVAETPDFVNTSSSSEYPMSCVSSSSDNQSQSSSDWEEPEQATKKNRTTRTSKRSAVTKPQTGRGRKTRIQPEERQSRKKEQNKTAATRYREKKKLQQGLIQNEEMALEKRNRKLQKQHDALAQELRFMKKLIRDVFKSSKSS